jgi:hypothetical protein
VTREYRFGIMLKMNMTDHPPPEPVSPRLTQLVSLFLLIFGGCLIVFAMGAIVIHQDWSGVVSGVLGVVVILLGAFADRDRIQLGQLHSTNPRGSPESSNHEP